MSHLLFRRKAWLALLPFTMLLALVFAGNALAVTTVQLGTANGFAILAGTAITDTPTSTITGDVGLSPLAGSFITGLGCPEVAGTIYAVDATGQPCFVANPGMLTVAKNDLTNAFNDAAGRTPATVLVGGDNQLGGQTLGGGVYSFSHATTANLTGDLTLAGDGNAVWIFQAASDLITASASRVLLTGGASACNVFWVVNSSATLGSGSTFVGTILALTSITSNSGVTIDGRLLARNAAVTIANNTIRRPGCSGSSSGDHRGIYCDAAGKSYNLLLGENLLPPWNALNLTPGYVDPVTGSASCTFPVASPVPVVTPVLPAPVPTPITPAPKPKPKPAAKPKPVHKVKAAVVVKKKAAVHAAPPKSSRFGFTG